MILRWFEPLGYYRSGLAQMLLRKVTHPMGPLVNLIQALLAGTGSAGVLTGVIHGLSG